MDDNQDALVTCLTIIILVAIFLYVIAKNAPSLPLMASENMND